MKKEFLLNMALLVGINLLIKPFYAFGIDLQVQNRVGMEEYGLYFALFNFSYLFQILSDLGLQQYNSRFVAQQPQLISKYLPHFLVLKGLLALVFFVCSLLTALCLGYSSYDTLPLLLLLLGNQVLITLIFFLRSNFAGLQRYRLDSLLSAADKVLMIVIMAILLWGPWAANFNIFWFAYAQTASFLLTAILVWFLLRRNLKEKLKFRWDAAKLLVVLRQSWPYALAVFLMTAYTRVDAVMIERLLPGAKGELESGTYAFGYRLLDAFNMVGFLFASLLLPMYARMLAQKESIADLLKTAFQWMFFLTASLSFCVLFFGNDLTYWMLDAATPYTVAVFGLLIWSSHAAGIIYVFGTLLTSSGNLKWMNRVFAAGLLLNLIGNALLIPHYGAWGAALATLVTQSFVAIVELWLVYRFIPSARPIFRWMELFRILLLCAGMYMLYGLVSTYGKYYIDWRLGLLFSGLCGLAWAERIGFLDLKGFFKILRSKNL